MVLKLPDIHIQKNESIHRSYTLHKKKKKYLEIDPSCKCKMQNFILLEENTEKNLYNFGFGDGILDITLKA